MSKAPKENLEKIEKENPIIWQIGTSRYNNIANQYADTNYKVYGKSHLIV